MDKLDIQVMLADGTFADYEVLNERDGSIYEIQKAGEKLAVFEASADGSWKLSENPGNVDADLEQRIVNQLNGLRR